MNKNKIILISSLIIAIAGVFVFFKSDFGRILIRPAQKESLPPPPPIPSEYTTPTETKPAPSVVYAPDKKFSSKDLMEYKSEYGGYSVMAPKGFSSLGCGHGCNPKSDGELFNYILIPEEGSGVPGMTIDIIKKTDGTNLENWVSKYIVSGSGVISSTKKTTVKNYPALQFDIQKTKSNASDIIIKSAVYPLGNEYDHSMSGIFSSMPPMTPIRFFVVDLGDRYALISYTLSIDNKAFFESLSTLGVLGPLSPKTLDNKNLAEIYKTIMDSFQAFTPTKS